MVEEQENAAHLAQNLEAHCKPDEPLSFPESPPTPNLLLEADTTRTPAATGTHANSGSTSSTSGYSSTGADSLEHLAQLSPAECVPAVSSASGQGTSPSSVRSLTLNIGAQQRSFAGDGQDTMSSPEDHLSSSLSPSGGGHVFTPTFDSDIRSSVKATSASGLPQYSCPNVSLSPILEHRLTSLSSISSGRNTSFDETDIPIHMTGDVLVVSHGGLIKQMMLYFVDDLGCRIPGGPSVIMSSPYNTALSKFIVGIYNDKEIPRVTCVFVNDKEHLHDSNVEALEKSNET